MLFLLLRFASLHPGFAFVVDVLPTPQPTTSSTTPLHTTTSAGSNPYVTSKPLLDHIYSPHDVKMLSSTQLPQLASEVRWDVLESVSQTGGHLSSSLGVVELTVALHYVFDITVSGNDDIIWDVSHQCYPHKILTGRRGRMHTLRQANGLSGFCKRAESAYDCFGAGHSSTSISAAQGMAITKKNGGHAIAVIGDGAMTGGMAYEAMNSAGYLKTAGLIVILNDNGQVSLPTGTPSAGGTVPASQLSTYTSQLLVSRPFQEIRDLAKRMNQFLPDNLQSINKRIDEYARGVVTGGTLFEEMGFYYVGPVDGHDLPTLVSLLEQLRDGNRIQKPVLFHVKTNKGHGYEPAEHASDRMHGVGKFHLSTGKSAVPPPKPSSPEAPSFTSVFANTLVDAALDDPDIVGVTAAMPGGTGMDTFGQHFPDRMYDVGIAEQHAVTMAAGMATKGMRPFVCIYSTFLQRGYDQVIHDVAIQNLPVRFVLDRAGLVGNDGPTHHGVYDLSYLGCIPGMTIMAPSDEIELRNMVKTMADYDDGPTAVRYPRGKGYGTEALVNLFGYDLEKKGGINGDDGEYVLPKPQVLEIGKGRIVRDHSFRVSDRQQRIVILSLGTRLGEALKAAQILEEEDTDLHVTVADARFLRPLDTDLIDQLVQDHAYLITIEEGSVGGFGSHVLQYMVKEGYMDTTPTLPLTVRNMVIPDQYFEAATQVEQYERAGLMSKDIVEMMHSMVQRRKPNS